MSDLTNTNLRHHASAWTVNFSICGLEVEKMTKGNEMTCQRQRWPR